MCCIISIILTCVPAVLSEADIVFSGVCLCLCVYVYVLACVDIHVVARSNSCKNVVLGCGRLRGLISYFLATRCSQMNAEAANDVDPKY